MNGITGQCRAVQLDDPSRKTRIACIVFSIGGQVIELAALDRARRVVAEVFTGIVYLSGAAADDHDRRVFWGERLHKAGLGSEIFRKRIGAGFEVREGIRSE